ncbi:putative Sterigmatocystin 8-O-methyltransferase [Diaporthe sp. PMI_573]|nr:putative Sterigmatocystin 8-O-methyltransferase [Diaporthaceae sp. PMI_573]
MLRRLLRHAMTLRIFREPRPGMVAHTQASKLLARSDVNSFMAFHPEIGWPTAAKTLDALQKWPSSEEPDETAFSLADNEGGSIYDAFGRDQERALRFAAGMQVFGALPRFNMSSAVNGFDWESLGQAKVVDVGGSRGHLAVALAQRFPQLTFVVQDMEKVVEEGRSTLAPGLHGRIKFMAHDFFKPQEVSADAYLLRTILHNWSDKYCVAILRALVPALKPGAKILINEICLPEPGSMPAHLEAELRLMDLSMGSVFNGKERDSAEWQGLLTRADPRFVLQNIVQPSGSSLAMIEVDWCADS